MPKIIARLTVTQYVKDDGVENDRIDIELSAPNMQSELLSIPASPRTFTPPQALAAGMFLIQYETLLRAVLEFAKSVRGPGTTFRPDSGTLLPPAQGKN